MIGRYAADGVDVGERRELHIIISESTPQQIEQMLVEMVTVL